MPDRFQDFEINLVVSIAVKGSDYEPSDFDNSEAIFRETLTKEAREGIRHTDLNIVDCWAEEPAGAPL